MMIIVEESDVKMVQYDGNVTSLWSCCEDIRHVLAKKILILNT